MSFVVFILIIRVSAISFIRKMIKTDGTGECTCIVSLVVILSDFSSVKKSG